ncbi:hypothetical protein [Acidovorax sp. sic0104]|uniref:hypothetical protein n=1 Tax=Acidovorax sp. sic0104 TaxID=2854784 RepID=UPI001C464A1E|nr:hypothetical protein [Acidovorax sp. sic0104]MBV7541994.1 hypothetical protein [Acidovorax sp. sic0104]
MPSCCLQIIADPDHDGSFRWVLLELVENEALLFKPHSAADCDFQSWESALNAGTIALAHAEGQVYENEAADPVGDASCEPAD